jgi:Carboxypeptidase regulatory-like domain
VKVKNFKFFIGVIACLAVILTAGSAVFAQETRGTVRGTITDQNSAVVSGAKVKIADSARGNSVDVTTNADGFYQAPYLTAGTYKITVEMTGFKTSVRDNVTLQIGQTIDVNIPLEIGDAQNVVDVTTDAPILETAKADLGLTVDAKRIAELPLANGDPYKLIGLAPGATFTGSARLDRPFEPTHIVGYAVDGTRGNRSDLTIDGVPSTSTANANEIIASYVPPTDIVQEFKVQTATFDAQFGNTEGGVTSISIKSGTNTLHGSAYYFGSPYKLSANDFFGNLRGQARPETKSDRFGGSLNGPVRIPWLYNGKDKTFFLFGYEGIRDGRPRFDATNVYTPTAALRNGDFSGLGVTIYDPLTRVNTGTTANPVYTAQPFAGNIIPADRISPIARAILNNYAQPKSGGLVGNIFDSTLQERTQPYNNYTVRIDQNVTDNNHLFVRGSYYDRISFYNDYLNSPATGVNFIFKSRQGVIDDVHTFNSSTFLNVRFGYNRFVRETDQDADARSYDLTQLGFSSAYNNLISGDSRRFPRFDFPNPGLVGTGFGNEFRPTDSQTYGATLNKIIGNHAFKFGAELRIYRENSVFTSNDQTGQFVFDNTYTRQASNGATNQDVNGLQGFAAFLLGLPTSQQVVRRADYSEFSKTYGFFVQDDWKFRSNLTLNLGLRYEMETPLNERQDKSVTGFDFDYVQPTQTAARARLVTNPVTGYSSTNSTAAAIDPTTFNVRGGLLFAGRDGGSNLYNTPKDTFLPRFGLAYSFNNKTVIRGGIGLFAGFLGQRRGDVIQTGFTRSTALNLTALASGAPIPQNIASFPNITILEPVGNSLGRQSGLGAGVSFFNQNPEVSKQLRYQVGIQRELPLGFTMEAVYVGNYGYNIEITRNINALPNQYLNADNSRSAAQIANNTNLTAQVANPFFGLAEYAGTTLANATVARSQLLRPFPNFGDINTTNNDGKSWYNSAQFSLQKRFAQGYTFQASYTFSKWIQATEYLNAADPTPTKMISDADAPHRLSFSGIYNLPFGKGRLFLSDANSFVDRLVSGWQINGTYSFQVGFPVSFTTDLFYNGGDISIDPSNRTTAQWFNTNVFTSILNSTSTLASPVNHLRTLPFRFSDVRRDNINDVNAFNEPYFPAPVINPTASTFGQISASNQDNFARRVQIAAKIVF